MRYGSFAAVSVGTIGLILLARSAGPQPSPTSRPGSDWPMYRHDEAGTGYSPLAQINEKNVASLVRVWTYSLQSNAAAPPPNSQATPIVVGGVMYVPTANRIVALEPDTGKEIWQSLVTGGVPSRRGVAYWPGAAGQPPRILFTSGRRLIALNAHTGASESSFGQAGEVDMVVPYNSVPLVYR